MTDSVLRCENISKNYGNVEALKGVSFELEEEGILGLLGDNGAGKSTLIKILRGVIQPTSGDMYIDGDRVEFDSPEDANHKGLYSVYQESALADNLSVAENFFMGREIVQSLAGLIDLVQLEQQESEAKQYLKERGFDLDVRQRIGEFSGGQRRAVAILRALYTQPRILLLDEPTTGLSEKAKTRMFELFEEIRDEVAMIFVSHSKEDVMKMCDRVLILRLGEPSFRGDVDEIDVDEILKYY